MTNSRFIATGLSLLETYKNFLSKVSSSHAILHQQKVREVEAKHEGIASKDKIALGWVKDHRVWSVNATRIVGSLGLPLPRKGTAARSAQ